MRNFLGYGLSDAARYLEETQDSIVSRQRRSVTFSRQEAIESVFQEWESANEAWKLAEGEQVVSVGVFETATRFIQSLPLGTPLPMVTGEPDGHINLEWYRSTRRLLSVSVGPSDRLYWAALIGTEDPRGSCRFFNRISKSLLYYIDRVCEG